MACRRSPVRARLAPSRQVPELKVTSEDKGRLVVGRAPNGDTVVEVRRGADGTTLQTKNAAWRVHEGEVFDAASTKVALIHRNLTGREIELLGGERIKVGRRLGPGHGCRFGDLADAKAPFLMPQRYFTLRLSDALLARQDRELLIGLFTSIADGTISAAIAASASGTTG